MRRFVLGAYWDARPDGLEECVDKSVRFLSGIAEADPLLAQWYEKGRPRKDALSKRVDALDARKLEDLLLRGRNRTDIGREVIPDLGFSVRLWNGADREEAEATVSIHCGCYNERIGNNVLIDLPSQPDRPTWMQNASALLALVAETWSPRWAGIMSEQAMEDRGFNADRPFVDWMVYVPRSIESLPAPSRVEPIADLGSIVVVQPNPPVAADADELARIRQVERLLAV